MGRAPCCDKSKVKKGPWSPEEDVTLKNYLEKYGTGGNWIALPSKAGLNRCGKSCRLRWLNYLRPDIRHGGFTDDEDNIICDLYSKLGSRWSVIASQLQGRTDNDVKNHWNTKLRKKLLAAKNNPSTTTTNHHYNNHHHHHTANSPTLHSSELFKPNPIKTPKSYNLPFLPPCSQNSPTIPEFPNTNYPLNFNDYHKMVYDPIQFSLPQVPELSNHSISSSTQEASNSCSSSLILDSNYVSWSDQGGFGGFSMDFGNEIINGGLSEERDSEIGTYSGSLANYFSAEIKPPQGLLQSVTNQY